MHSVLHLTFHDGCARELEFLAERMSLRLTSWNVLSCQYPHRHFDGCSQGNSLYNLGYDRARRVWERHRGFFERFDAIITSDTAPLSRVFLQNGWNRPLIIWVCNRFDYADTTSLDCCFPDPPYYELFRKAASMDHVRIVSYTPFERVYAQSKGVELGARVIKPTGGGAIRKGTAPKNGTGDSAAKNETLFVHPRLPSGVLELVLEHCRVNGVPVFHGGYDHPRDLRDFLGVLFFPYAYSNFSLFENLQHGIVHFVPHEEFYRTRPDCAPIYCPIGQRADLCEWYTPENRDLFVYFRSWEDLRSKLDSTPFSRLRRHILSRALQHRELMLARWKAVVRELDLR